MDKVFGDIVYDTDENVTLTGLKRFDTIIFKNDLTITSGLINDRHLDEFVTSDTDQVLNISYIKGDLEFMDLKLGGLFGGVNVTELDRNTIKTNGDQYTEAELEYETDNDYDIIANTILIEKSINGQSVDDLIAERRNIVIRDHIELDDLEVDNLEVSCI